MRSIECLRIIEATRKLAGVTQKEMCKDIMNVYHYRKCLNGSRQIGADKLMSLMDLFPVDFNSLDKK